MVAPTQRNKRNNKNEPPRGLIVMSLLIVGLMLTPSCSHNQPANSSNNNDNNVAPKTFPSPAAAGSALLDAAKSGDQQALLSIFGSEGKDLIFSGDAVKDKNTAEQFVAAYNQMNRWSKENSGEESLYIGADNFIFPIPLKQNGSGQWAFDTAAGRDEVLARRIGDGELTAIGVLTELADAQQEYFSQNHQFSQRFVSDEGQRNGLYWPVAEGQRPSPLGRLADLAEALGYSHSDKPQPFNGYYYRILTRQGDTAKGGAQDYLKNGKLTGGFAILAWPAKYRDSGIMSFIVGKDGVIYQQDLGEKSSAAPEIVTAYDPNKSWTVVTPESANAAPSPSTRGEQKQDQN